MEEKNDALRGKFTVWMKVVIKRAKIDYIRRLNRCSPELSIDDEFLNDKLIYEQPLDIEDTAEFVFENVKLAKIFNTLSRKRRRIIEMLFLHNLTPEEVADKLKCSVQHVHNLRYVTIKELKNNLSKEGKLK